MADAAAARRVKEAGTLADSLTDVVHHMKSHEREFVVQIAERYEQWGDATFVSEKQLQWLRDLEEKYL